MTSEVGITAWKGEWQYNEDDFLTTTRMNKDRELGCYGGIRPAETPRVEGFRASHRSQLQRPHDN
jgi:hypothetical protein